MTRRLILVALFVASLVPSAGLPAQESARAPAAPQTFTLGQAMQYAVDHYPTVRAALEQVEASSAGVSIAKSAYLPRLDTIWQSNRATANNVFGQ
jgi:outer membrane protein TolC